LIDNNSNDGSQDILKAIASKDKVFKVIINTKNFGHIRSPYYAFTQASGDAVVFMASDLEDPPELIYEMIAHWESGYKIVIGVRTKTEEKGLLPYLRQTYYFLIAKFSSTNQIANFSGFGLYDKDFVDIVKKINDPYPYFRGFIDEFGFKFKKVFYKKPFRKNGFSKGSMPIYYDNAMLGLVNHSYTPLRLVTLIGFILSLVSIFISFYYFFKKIMNWNDFTLGIAPLIIAFFLFFGILFIFLGILGEYIIHLVRLTTKRPFIIEKERINF
jgi:glycosyltransferase involved in cell wall biosynthesis